MKVKESAVLGFDAEPHLDLGWFELAKATLASKQQNEPVTPLVTKKVFNVGEGKTKNNWNQGIQYEGTGSLCITSFLKILY